jgi:hypothetical protein
MKKSRIFMAAGAFVLAISAVFATKANKKFTAINTAYSRGSVDGYTCIVKTSDLFTTVATGNVQAYVAVISSSGTLLSTAIPLYTSTSGTSAKLFVP